MKHKFLGIAAAAAVSAVIFSGCTQNAADTSEDTSVADSEISVQVSASTSETKAETTEEIITKTEAAEENDDEPEYVEVSVGNEFIDYEFIENYQGATNIGDLADKAVEFLKTTEEYAESMKNISEFSDEEFSDYIKDGEIVPKFSIAYPNDYDGDGRTETFIAVDMPVHYSSNILTSFYIYADGAENMTLLDVSGTPGENVTFLNYGRDKQIAFGGGFSPYGSITYLYGVKYGSPVLLYSEQAGLEKRACFLRSHGFQASERFMYYDTAAREYRNIAAEKVSHDKLKSLDTSGSLNSVFEEHGDRFSAWTVGGKYYCIKVTFEFADVYTYDNGTFTLMNDPIAGLSIPISSEPCVKDIDIDSAVAEMKKPVEPFVKVSADNEFIDYEFIENYQGTKDIGDLADKAVDFLMTTDEYAEAMSAIEEIDEEFGEPYIADGKIIPQFETAYPEDYDGDGKTETFIIAAMPFRVDYSILTRFFIYADSNGNMTLLDHVSGVYDTILLNYGDFKQITFGGSGTVGIEDHTNLYSVENGKAKELFNIRGNFYKSNCFLSAFSWQSSGAFMYYDTAAGEYRAIDGKSISIEKIKEMDSTNALSEFYEWYDENGFLFAELIGDRYYVFVCGVMDSGTAYLYENGEFIQTEECSHVRNNHFDRIIPKVVDIDINKAIAEMKSVK